MDEKAQVLPGEEREKASWTEGQGKHKRPGAVPRPVWLEQSRRKGRLTQNLAKWGQAEKSSPGALPVCGAGVEPGTVRP